MTIGVLAATIFILWVFVRTVSYGKWTWERKNRLGAVMIFIVALTVLILPIYTMYFVK
ncbi:MAG: hypothetical protein GX660_20445 [Clostridiaceae bacterium]|nr:hypothetical protein [Clostridiaceae bacterium]